MGVLDRLSRWPVLQQIRKRDLHALLETARSPRTEVPSVCPYCAVGCAQLVYVKDGRITDIEGTPTPRSPKAASAPRARPPSSSSPARTGSGTSSTAGPTAP